MYISDAEEGPQAAREIVPAAGGHMERKDDAWWFVLDEKTYKLLQTTPVKPVSRWIPSEPLWCLPGPPSEPTLGVFLHPETGQYCMPSTLPGEWQPPYSLRSEQVTYDLDGLGIWIDPRRFHQFPAPGGLPGFLAPYQPPYYVEFTGPTTGGKKALKGPFASWQEAERYVQRNEAMLAGQGYYQIVDGTGLPVDRKEFYGPGL